MAVVTKYYLMEEVRSLLSGGDPSAGSKFEPRMVMVHIAQAINSKLRVEYFNTTLPADETLPENLVLASYDNIAVEAYKDRSRAKLPAIPIALRRNMGIFHVSLTDDLDNPFIPLQSGQFAFVKTQNLINGLLGQVGYEYADGYVVFTEDLAARAVPVSAVFMRLVVMDFDKYSDYDLLPLPADMAGDILKEVYNLLMQTPPKDGRVDSMNEETPDKRPIE